MLVLAALTVHYNYGGNWTALYLHPPGHARSPVSPIGAAVPFPNQRRLRRAGLPPDRARPVDAQGSPRAIAGVPISYQRILVPALAWTLALGQDRWVHAAYFAVILGFVFLGVYWLAVPIADRPGAGLGAAIRPYARRNHFGGPHDGGHRAAALAAGFAFYADDSPGPAVFAVLAAAALARETGLLIIAGYVIYLFTRRNIRGALLAASAALPALAWSVVLLRFGPPEAQKWGSWIPFAGFVDRVIHPSVYHVSRVANAGAQVFDLMALAGVALALVQAARLLIRRRWNARTPAIYVLALAVVFIGSRPLWDDAYGFGRVLSPFLLLAALEYAAGGPVIAFLPIFLVDARIGLNFISQIAGVFRGIFGI